MKFLKLLIYNSLKYGEKTILNIFKDCKNQNK
jgi:hypothetical protein